MRKLRTRLALRIAPWLKPMPYVTHTPFATTASNANYRIVFPHKP